MSGTTPLKIAKYKSRSLSKIIDDDSSIKKSIENLPSELSKLLSQEAYQQFLEKALSMLEDQDDSDNSTWRTKDAENLACNLEVILPVFGYSTDKHLHKLVQQFYYNYEYIDVDPSSRYEYTFNACSLWSVEGLIPEDWIDEVFPHDKRNDLADAEEELRKKRLEIVRQNVKFFTTQGSTDNVTANKLKVENELAKRMESKIPLRDSSYLLNVVLDFLEEKNVFKLDSKFAKVPGVYLIYYLGETELYEGSQVNGSIYCPVYVGMSVTDVSNRLSTHKSNIKKAKGDKNEAAKLNLEDFAVKVIFPEIKHYAPCMEGMLIEHFDPLWNRESIGFCFGNASSDNNLWKKFYIHQDKKTIDHILAQLFVYANSSTESSEEYSSISEEEEIISDVKSSSGYQSQDLSKIIDDCIDSFSDMTLQKNVKSQTLQQPSIYPSCNGNITSWHFPQQLSQSTINGRIGSNACTFIALFISKYFFDFIFNFPDPEAPLSNVWISNIIFALERGNEEYDKTNCAGKFYGAKEAASKIKQLLDPISFEEEVAVSMIPEETPMASLPYHLMGDQNTSSIFIVGGQSVAIIKKNNKVIIVDSHLHDAHSTGAFVALSSVDHIFELLQWFKTYKGIENNLGSVTNVTFNQA